MLRILAYALLLCMCWDVPKTNASTSQMRHAVLDEAQRALYYLFKEGGKQPLQIQLSPQLDCHLSAPCILLAWLHRVFGYDLSVDSQLQQYLSAVPVDCLDYCLDCSQLG